jgi:lipoate-protein ligase A
MWVLDLTSPALVLGSRQDSRVIDPDGARAQGYEVVRRRSGGTMVHLLPGEVLWVDVTVPASHRAFTQDVRASMLWMGERWVSALTSLTAGEQPANILAAEASRFSVHSGAVEKSSWADLLCFGGFGPGEVAVDGAKLVGMSQRRSRDGARFQMAVHHRFALADLNGVWAVPTPPEAQLGPVATLSNLTLSSPTVNGSGFNGCGELGEQLVIERLAQQLSV